MISSTLHLKYGQALYQAAVKQQMEDQVLHDLKAVSVLYQHKRLKRLMDEVCLMPKENQHKVLTATFEGKIHQLVFNLLRMLASRQGMVLLPKINDRYRQVYHEAKGISEIIVRTAKTLSKDEEHAMIKQLEQKKKNKITVHFEQVPSLIGGVQIYEKGYLTDYSVQNYLRELQKHLLHQETPFEN